MNRLMPVVVAIPGDLHFTAPGLANVEAARHVLDEINRVVRPDFVQFIGDNVQDATEGQYGLFNGLRSRLDVPHFALVGDHDVKDDPEAQRFRRHVGDPLGAHSVRGFRFVRLNTQEARPVGISAGQVEWFRHEVDSALARGERVVVFQHNYPYQIWEDFDGPGIDGWRSIVQTRRVEAIVCGHTHYWQVANDGRNVAIATRSIGDPEGGPPGYTILHLDGDDLAATFRPVDETGPIVLVTHPRSFLLATGPRHVVRGTDRLVVRVWSPTPTPARSVRFRLDDGDWRPLDPADEGYWVATLAGDRLAKGVHDLEVAALTSLGAEGRQKTDFVIDPTGRYTPVPQTRPEVTSTAFC